MQYCNNANCIAANSPASSTKNRLRYGVPCSRINYSLINSVAHARTNTHTYNIFNIKSFPRQGRIRNMIYEILCYCTRRPINIRFHLALSNWNETRCVCAFERRAFSLPRFLLRFLRVCNKNKWRSFGWVLSVGTFWFSESRFRVYFMCVSRSGPIYSGRNR